MLAAGWGRIVNVASTGRRGYAYVSGYVAAKHGVLGLTRALALELATRASPSTPCAQAIPTDLLKDSIANIVAKTGRSEAEARAQLASGNRKGAWCSRRRWRARCSGCARRCRGHRTGHSRRGGR
jgi:NAD(P)-dependent dehydrogenase (short-subunit alcohol dehydrogenase family)